MCTEISEFLKELQEPGDGNVGSRLEGDLPCVAVDSRDEINTHAIDQNDPRKTDLLSEAVVKHACPLQHVCAQRMR